jgi:hypothetical protein
LYHLISSINDVRELTARLLRLAEQTAIARDNEALEEISAVMCALPLRAAQDAGQYYKALLARRQGDDPAAADLLAPLASQSKEPWIQIKALNSLAGVHELAGDYPLASRLYVHVTRRAATIEPASLVKALWQLSAISSSGGDHQTALEQISRTWPVVRAIASNEPYYFYCWHNEVAFELLQLGQIEQAAKYSAVAVASPIVDRYPEWLDTGEQIIERQSSPVTIAVSVSAPISADEETEEIQSSLNPHLSESIPPVRDFPDVRKVLIFSRLQVVLKMCVVFMLEVEIE